MYDMSLQNLLFRNTSQPPLTHEERAMQTTKSILFFLATVAVATACWSRNVSEPSDLDGLTAEQKEGVSQVRTVTAQYQSFGAAQQAGYTNQYPAGCAQSTDGTQGFHYLNNSLVDDKVELLRPELVMYEPQADGSKQLIGVDYVVPFDAWKSATPPSLLGMPFMRNEPLGVWALHIWAHRSNPSGMFAMWNPKASCTYAQ